MTTPLPGGIWSSPLNHLLGFLEAKPLEETDALSEWRRVGLDAGPLRNLSTLSIRTSGALSNVGSCSGSWLAWQPQLVEERSVAFLSGGDQAVERCYLNIGFVSAPSMIAEESHPVGGLLQLMKFAPFLKRFR